MRRAEPYPCGRRHPGAAPFLFYGALSLSQADDGVISEDICYYWRFMTIQVESDRRPFYVFDWSWDTYLASNPLREILHHAPGKDMLQSYVRMYRAVRLDADLFPCFFGIMPV